MTPRAHMSASPEPAADGAGRFAARPGRGATGPGGGPAASGGSTFFYGEPEAARDWNMSPGGLSLARSRGELEGAYEIVGRRVLYSRIAPRLHALGLRTPEDLGRFVEAAGVRNLNSLLEFLGADAGPGRG